MDLFSIQDEAGPGLIFWHPKGGIIRKEIEDFLRDELLRQGYQLVYTAARGASGSLENQRTSVGFYKENMFTPIQLDDAEYQLKPMNCPFPHPDL